MVADIDENTAEVILAECSGQAWLVRGEQHIDDLLGNTMQADVSIGVVSCESKSEVDELWWRWNDTDLSEMWMIHPAIVNRVRGKPAMSAILFPAWSAALDATAQQVIDLAAKVAIEREDAVVALVRHVAADGGRTIEDLGGLRCTLIEGRLAEAGVPPSRIVRDTTPASSAEDAERIDVLVR